MKLEEGANVVLIGMPGVGKSTIGVLLAKALSREFLDTDLLIQTSECRPLRAIIAEEGSDAFCRLEERYVLMLELRDHVIATGGSVVYSEHAMEHLRNHGVVVYLSIGYRRLKKRVRNLAWRGVVLGPGQDLAGLYEERVPLYEKYSNVEVACDGLSHEEVLQAVLQAVEER